MRRGILFLVSIIGVCAISLGQQKLPNTLLWKISGKGLANPSYLFGSIHLSDERVFNLGDSVYQAIAKTEGLAIEINPDEIGAYAIKDFMGGNENNGKKIVDLLTPESFREYATILEEKLGKPAKDITTVDVLNAKNKWMSNYMTEGSMSSFLDAWLYQLARKQGKWLGGLEDIEDYEKATEGTFGIADIKELITTNDKPQLDKSIESMITLYLKQDIDSIEMSMRTPDSSGLEKSMVRRNIKMSRRMDSLIQLRTMFFTVGSAHLSGTFGIITLLRNKGFIVEPVYSSSYIHAKNYQVKEQPIKWTEVKHKNYRFLNQGNPAFTKMYGIMDMHFYFDIAEFAAYTVLAIPINLSNKNKDSLLNQMRDNVFGQDGEPTEEKFSRNGYEGKDYVMEAEDQYMRIQMIPHENLLLMAMVNGPNSGKISPENVTKFFNSIEIYPPSKAEIDNNRFYNFGDKKSGISFTSPINLEYSSTLSEKSTSKIWKGTVYGGADEITGSYIFYYLSEAQPGYYVQDNNQLETEWYKSLKNEYANLSMKDSLINGNKVKIYQGDRNNYNDQRIRAVSTIQYGKRHMVAVVTSNAMFQSPRIDTIFQTFAFHPPVFKTWELQQASDNSFRTFGPGTFQLNPEQDNTQPVFISYDTATSYSILFLRDTLSQYTSFRNRNEIWETHKPTLGNDMSIEKEVKSDNKESISHEWLIKIAGSDKQFRAKFIINGNLLYKIFAFADPEYLKTENVEKAFNNYAFTTKGDPNWIFIPKTSQLIKDLESTEYDIRAAAYQYLNNNDIHSAKDTTVLAAKLLTVYLNPYSDNPSGLINIAIGKALGKLNEPLLLSTIESKYKKLDPLTDNELIQSTLAILAKQQSANSYQLLAKLIPQKQVKVRPGYTVSAGLTNNKILFKQHLSLFTPFITDSIWGPTVVSVLQELYDSSYLSKEELKTLSVPLLKHADMIYHELLQADSTDYMGEAYSIAYLLSKTDIKEALDLASKFTNTKNRYLKNNIAIMLLSADINVPSNVLTDIAKFQGTRLDLYYALEEQKKESLYPPAFLTQRLFADAAIFKEATYDYEEDDVEIKFHGIQTSKFQDTVYMFYLYKVTFKEEEGKSTYLGIAGGYKLGSKMVTTAKELTGIYYDDVIGDNDIKAILEIYLKNLDKNEENEDE